MTYVFSQFELSHQKPKTSAPLSLFRTKPDVLFFLLHLLSDQPDLSYDHDTTSDISPPLFNPLSSHLNQDKIWPFYPTYSFYLLFESTVLQPQSWSPLEDESNVPTVHSQRNKCFFFFFVPLPGVCKRMEQRVLMVNESRVCTKAAYQVSQKDSLQPPASL